MKIKIISDGTARGTKVVNAETGESIENVIGLEWGVRANGGFAVADLHVVCMSVEIEGDAEVESIPIESLFSE